VGEIGRVSGIKYNEFTKDNAMIAFFVIGGMLVIAVFLWAVLRNPRYKCITCGKRVHPGHVCEKADNTHWFED
jgi:hypothetical protein